VSVPEFFKIKVPRNGVEKTEEWSFSGIYGDVPNPNQP
jgi:hypothetical protein